MNTTFWKTLPLTMLSLLLMSACTTPSTSPGVYSVGEARSELRVRSGVIESMSPVTIRPEGHGGGTLVGGILGGIAGSGVGSGNERAAASILGAVVGATIGEKVQQSVNTRQGVQIIIKLDDATTIGVVQDADQDLRVGDKVNVLSDGAVSRVVRR